MAKAPPREQKRPENPKARKSRTPLARSKDPDYMKLTVYVPIDLQRAVKARLVGQGRQLSDLVERLLCEWNGRAHQD
jgi:hypothetical protein